MSNVLNYQKEMEDIYYQEQNLQNRNQIMEEQHKQKEEDKLEQIQKFNNCPKHALKILSKHVNILPKLKEKSLQYQLWSYFQKSIKISGTKILIKLIFQNPYNLPHNKRGNFITQLLSKYPFQQFICAQNTLKQLFLKQTSNINFQQIVLQRNFQYKKTVLLTIHQLLYDLRHGKIRKKLMPKTKPKPYKKRQKNQFKFMKIQDQILQNQQIQYNQNSQDIQQNFEVKVEEQINNQIYSQQINDFVCQYLL